MATPFSPHGEGRAPRTARPGKVRTEAGAFTLVEVLAVVAIIAVLAGLVFGAAAGARERSRRAHTAAELAVLSQALEAYRAVYGDYPATGPVANNPAGTAASDDGPGILFNALAGRRGPGATAAVLKGRCFVVLGAHVLQTETMPVAGDPAPAANAFIDPWGRRYLYWYRTGNAWTRRGPVLLSAGRDGAVTGPEEPASWDGTLPAGSANEDNVEATP